MIQPVRGGQSSLECSCYNCVNGIRRSNYNIELYGAYAYRYNCHLTYNEDNQLCYQATHCCKHWKEKKEKTDDPTNN